MWRLASGWWSLLIAERRAFDEVIYEAMICSVILHLVIPRLVIPAWVWRESSGSPPCKAGLKYKNNAAGFPPNPRGNDGGIMS
jgi:hypothetical protein